MDEILARDASGLYYHQDRIGNVSAVSHANGEVIEQYRYDAFGAPEIRSGAVAGNPNGELNGTTQNKYTLVNNRFLFTGRKWAAAYGFYEYRNRAYNPKLGRFMSEDPKGFAAGDRNLFRYCGGDPVNRVDPMGLEEADLPPGLLPRTIKAALNTRNSLQQYPQYGPGRSQFITPGQKFGPITAAGDKPIIGWKRSTRSGGLVEAGRTYVESGPGNYLSGGHVHDDKGVAAGKVPDKEAAAEIRKYTDFDKDSATGRAAYTDKNGKFHEAVPGRLIAKSYSSNERVDYLHPNKEPGQPYYEKTATDEQIREANKIPDATSLEPDPRPPSHSDGTLGRDPSLRNGNKM